MSDEDRVFITPPPGLLPELESDHDPTPNAVNTGSQTRRIASPISAPPVVPMPIPPIAGPISVAVGTQPEAPRPEPARPESPRPESPRPETSRSTAWTLILSDGSEREITGDGIVLGRNPTAPAAWPRAEPVPIDDPGKSVSKTHAVLLVADGRLRILDLRSTNGVAVTVDGDHIALPADGMTIDATSAITLGEYGITARAPGVF